MTGRSTRLSLVGRVLDSEGKPVPGVSLYWVDVRYAGREEVDRHHVHARGMTDNEGRFWAVDLPAGPGLLVPDLMGCSFAGDRMRIGHGTRVELPLPQGAAEPVVRFPFTPQDFARLKGSLRDPSGKPIPGRTLMVASPEDPPQIRRNGRTDDAGNFEMVYLSPGPCRLLVFGDRELADGALPVDLQPAGTVTATVTAHARSPGERFTARVRCVDELGLPVIGARVSVGVSNTDIPGVESDEDGIAVFTDLPVRPVTTVAVAPGRAVESAAPQVGAGGESVAEIVLRRTVPVLVAVRDAETGEQLPSAGIDLGQEGFAMGHHGAPPPPGTSGPPEHRYRVLPGLARIRVDAPGYEGEDREIDVPSDPDEPMRIDIRLQRRP